MKSTKSNLLVIILLIVVAALYRVWDGRPFGFAPQIAMAIFAGSVIQNKKIAFLFPLLSMFVSDALYQILYLQGLTVIKGFYGGQLVNYLIIAAISIVGFFIKTNKIKPVVVGSLIGTIGYFILSNFSVWLSGLDINNVPYPKNLTGFIACYVAAIPFLKWSLISTLLFSGIFFGGFYLLKNKIFSVELHSA